MSPLEWAAVTVAGCYAFRTALLVLGGILGAGD